MSQRRKQERKNLWELNKNENTTQQNICNTLKVVLQGRFIVLYTYIKKLKRAQINDLTMQLKNLEKRSNQNQIKLMAGNNEKQRN